MILALSPGAFPLPTLDTLGRMFLHLSPLASLLTPCLDALGHMTLHWSQATLDTLGQRCSLPLSWLDTLGLGRMHLSLCLFPCFDTLGRVILHLSPTCLPAGLSACLPACLTSQVQGGLKAFDIFYRNNA